MRGSRSENEKQRPGRCFTVTRPVLSTAVACLIAALLLCGCGSEEKAVNGYLDIARKVVTGLTAASAGLNKFWNLPLADQEGIEDALKAFRKSISNGQDRLDRIDAPEPCREVDLSLGKSLDLGREITDIGAQFADYLGGTAPLARRASDIVTGVSNLQYERYIASQLVRYADLAQKLMSDFQTVTVSPNFKPVHEDFGAFLQLLVKNLDQASKQAERQPYNEEELQSQPGEREKQMQPESMLELLNGISEEWGRVNGAMTAHVDTIRQFTGLKPKQIAFDDLLRQIQGQIEAIAKQY